MKIVNGLKKRNNRVLYYLRRLSLWSCSLGTDRWCWILHTLYTWKNKFFLKGNKLQTACSQRLLREVEKVFSPQKGLSSVNGAAERKLEELDDISWQITLVLNLFWGLLSNLSWQRTPVKFRLEQHSLRCCMSGRVWEERSSSAPSQEKPVPCWSLALLMMSSDKSDKTACHSRQVSPTFMTYSIEEWV